jgi:hypothetical protein
MQKVCCTSDLESGVGYVKQVGVFGGDRSSRGHGFGAGVNERNGDESAVGQAGSATVGAGCSSMTGRKDRERRRESSGDRCDQRTREPDGAGPCRRSAAGSSSDRSTSEPHWLWVGHRTGMGLIAASSLMPGAVLGLARRWLTA